MGDTLGPIRVLIRQHLNELAPRDLTAWPAWWPLDGDWTLINTSRCTIAAPTGSHRLIRAAATTYLYLADLDTGQTAPPAQPGNLVCPPPCAALAMDSEEVGCYAAPGGKGTFYYIERDGYFIASTSLQDVCCAAHKWEPDEDTVTEYLLRSYSPIDLSRTFVAGIRQVPPGCVLSSANGQVMVRSYWLPPQDPDTHRLPLVQAVDRIRVALGEAVATAIGPARSVGIFYSGGLDSSTVAAFALQHQRRHGGEVILFSADEQVSTPEECALRRTFADAVGCRLVEVPIDLTQDLISILQRLNRYAPHPSGGVFEAGFDDIARAARACGVEVMFTGDGGEEMFAFQGTILADYLLRGHWRGAYKSLALLKCTQLSGHSLARSGLLPAAAVLRGARGSTILSALCELTTRSLPLPKGELPMSEALYGDFTATRQAAFRRRWIDNLRHQYVAGWTLNDYDLFRNMVAVGKRAADWADYPRIHGLRVDSPLADPLILQAVMTLRLEDRVDIGVGYRSKRLLRLAAGPLIPEVVRNYPKTNIVDLLWRVLRHHRRTIGDLLDSPSLRHLGIGPDATIRDLEQLPQLYLAVPFMNLIILGIWLDALKEVVHDATAARV